MQLDIRDTLTILANVRAEEPVHLGTEKSCMISLMIDSLTLLSDIENGRQGKMSFILAAEV